jgi:hypothetical protein
MHSLKANTENEIRKMFLRSKVRACFILAVAIPAVIFILIDLLHSKSGILAVGGSSFPIFILGLFTSVLLPLFIFMWAADAFAGEVGEGTMKITLMRPITRFKVYLSKTLALSLATVLLLAIMLLAASICGLFLSSGVSQFISGWVNGLKACILAVVPMISMVITAVFLSQFFRSSSGALTCSILVYIVGRFLPVVEPVAGKVLIFSYTNWHTLWLGNITDPARLLYAFMIMVSTSILLFTGGFYIFDTREL